MNTNGAALVILVVAMGAAGAVSTGTQFTGATAPQLHALACKSPAPSDNPWHIRNLYDCKTSTLYIPAQLRTGAPWDGAKTRERLAAARACGFPIGPGWALSVRRTCADAAVEITAIRLNTRNELESIEFNAWRGTLRKDGYRYVPGKGMTAAWGY